jgi:hypothetical protein
MVVVHRILGRKYQWAFMFAMVNQTKEKEELHFTNIENTLTHCGPDTSIDVFSL